MSVFLLKIFYYAHVFSISTYDLKRIMAVLKEGQIMKLIKQAGILLLFYFLGDLLSKLLTPFFVFPSAVLGMLLLFLALLLGIVKEDQIKELCDWLLGNIGLFFIPISVGIIAIEGFGLRSLLPLLFVGILSTIITMTVTMLVTHVLSKEK